MSAVMTSAPAIASAVPRPTEPAGHGFWGLVLALALSLAVTPRPAVPETPADTLHRPTPRGALLRSAILPGWGQYANGHPLKALVFGTTAAGFLGATIAETRTLHHSSTPQEHQDRVARRNTRVLFLLATTTLSALEAYVDAQLASFTIETGLQTSSLQLRISLPLRAGCQQGSSSLRAHR